MVNKKIIQVFVILLMLTAIVSAGIMEQQREERVLRPSTITTDTREYTGTFQVLISEEEARWVDHVEIVNREVKVIAKDLSDRTYQECKAYERGIKDDPLRKCLEYENVTYPRDNPTMRNIPITTKDRQYITSISTRTDFQSRDIITYDIKEEEHYIRIGENSIIIIEDIFTTADLVNITVEGNFSHLNISGTAPYDGLVGYWNFDDNSSNIIYDYSNENNDGVLINTTFIDDGIFGKSVSFDGIDDAVEITSATNLPNTVGSVSAWIKPFRTGGTTSVWELSDGTADNRVILYFSQYVTGVDQLFVFTSGSPNVWSLGSSSSTFIEGQWQHVHVNFETGPNVFKVYRNGVLVTPSTTNSGGNPTGIDRLEIGSFGQGAFYNGSIDEVMVFNKILTATQISDIYNNASARFKATGTHSISQNITSSFNGVTVTGDLQTELNSSIDLFIDYYNGSWFSTGEQVYDGDNTFVISDASTNLTLNFTYNAGSNNNSFNFYTPLILGENGLTLNITSDLIPCPYTGSGTWFVNQFCFFDFISEDVTGNITIEEGGSLIMQNSNLSINLSKYAIQYLGTTPVEYFVMNATAEEFWALN